MSENYSEYYGKLSPGFRPTKKVTFNTVTDDSYASREAVKTLRTNIMFSGEGIRSIVITSTRESEGKSTISTELAKSFADSGKRTLLVDADMRKSMMLKRDDRLGKISGLSELLSGLAGPSDVIYSTQEENFDVIFTGRFPPNPVELLGSSKLKEYLEDFKSIYDYIIIDSPPLGLVIDAAVISAATDGAIMVVSQNKVSRKAAIEVKAQLEKSGTKILGAIINETEKPPKKYGAKSKKYGYGEYYK